MSKKNSISHNGRTFFYYLSKATEKNKPIIFILHGHGFVDTPSQFKSDNWNVVCPMDNYGLENKGSWFLGENGDYFWLQAMEAILKIVREETGTGRLYFWGSSMGGYASLLYGYKLNATAVYANVPQTHLLGSQYSSNGMERFFSAVFESAHDEYNSLIKVFKTRSRTKYFMCFNQLEGSNYFSEQALPFITHLHSLKQPLYLEVRPTSSHGKNHGVSEAINLFKKYQ